jgi:hypothetical protein
VSIFRLNEIDCEKDWGKASFSGNRPPWKDCKIDQDEGLGTDFMFLEMSRKMGQKDKKKIGKI